MNLEHKKLIALTLLVAGCGAEPVSPAEGTEGEAEAEAEGELPESCPEPPAPIESCFRGAAFAECTDGPGPATVGCGALGCFWFSAGCLPEGYSTGCVPEMPSCTGDDDYRCWRFAYERGPEPWDRQREMTLAVDVDSALMVAETTVECQTCSTACTAGDNVCAYPDDDVASAGLPGTLLVNLDPWGGYLWGWRAEIEVDLQAPGARFCRIPLTDVICEPPGGDPPCAVIGTLTLSAMPTGKDQLVGLAGIVDATFDDGLRIQAEFVIE